MKKQLLSTAEIGVYASRPMFDVTLGLCHRFKTNQNTREFEIKLAWHTPSFSSTINNVLVFLG